VMRGRFAPTPSGLLHVGNAATALLAWLQVRQAGGRFILRMEDIDQPRCKPEFAEQIVDDLRWLGLDWDEGPDCGGPYGPYTQSARIAYYEQALERLGETGRLYPCYCSRADLLSAASAPHGIGAEGPVYPGTCRTLSEEERRRRSARKTPSLRFAVPERPVRFCDLALGPQQFPPGSGGDFIVKRADGLIAYQLAVTVDDAAMRVSDVLRGSDLLDSTPRQLMLHEALGQEPPRYAHVPLVHGPDGHRLSKRHKDLALAALRRMNVAPERVVGHLAHLYGLIDKPEPVKPAELVGTLDLSKLPGRPVTLPAKVMDGWEC